MGSIPMRERKRKRLEAAGWKVGTVEELLGLTPEEAQLIEMKLGLAKSVRERRQKAHLSQAALAARIASSQSRVAKLEAADPQVSMDLLVRAHLALGASKADVAHALLHVPGRRRRRRRRPAAA